MFLTKPLLLLQSLNRPSSSSVVFLRILFKRTLVPKLRGRYPRFFVIDPFNFT